MAADLLKASEAARRLGVPTKEVLLLIYECRIRFVMVKGIAHVPDDAVEEFPRKGLVVRARRRGWGGPHIPARASTAAGGQINFARRKVGLGRRCGCL